VYEDSSGLYRRVTLRERDVSEEHTDRRVSQAANHQNQEAS
jgi:hypothetical protein